jgi:murein DD-endopeptidase MepM/ murein hydrolase activator NlpD
LAVGVGVPGAPPAGGAPVARPDGPEPTEPAPEGFPVPELPAEDAPKPVVPDWLTAARTSGGGVVAEQGTIAQLAAAQTSFEDARKNEAAARKRLAEMRKEVANTKRVLDRIRRDREVVLERERDRAVNFYISGAGGELLTDLFSEESVAVQGRRTVYTHAAAIVDADRIKDLERRRRDTEKNLSRLMRQRDAASRAHVAARVLLVRAYNDFVALATIASDPNHGGRVFPVEGAFDFADSWGNFRADSKDGSGHHGVDIMAEEGTPVVAVETGFLDRIGWNQLGGWRLWINGVSGTKYYYAHMRAYAPGLVQDMPVVAGQYLGRVGSTGNAQGGPSHLHFEVHLPGALGTDDKVVNGYPLLCLLAGAPVPVIPTDDHQPIIPWEPNTTTSIPSGPATAAKKPTATPRG